MSIDVALSTRRGVGRNTYSLPQKRGCAPGAMSMDMALLSFAPVPCQCVFQFSDKLSQRLGSGLNDLGLSSFVLYDFLVYLLQ